jgi:twinkle protein
MVEREGNRIIGDSWEELNIFIPASKYNYGQNIKIRNCPECKNHGKRRDNTYDLSLIPSEGKGRCHKCGSVFLIRAETKSIQPIQNFTPPNRKNLTKLSSEGLQFFTNRKISQDAITAFKIVEENGYVAFPYFFNGDLVNIKYKKINEKKYRQSPNGKHVVFNYDEAKKYNAVVVCEGEEEVMCWFDAGVPYAVSVDAGAPNPNDKIEKKLECITHCFDLFENADVIYIAVDNDENGRRLKDELIRRFSFDKVRIVDFGKYKDGNEFLLYEGKEALKDLQNTAKELRLDGVFFLDDVEDKLLDMFENGLPVGETTHMPSVDKHWKWRPTEVTIGTGYNNEGKSTFFDINLPILKAYYDGWPVGLFVPENFPAEEFYEEVIHTFIGKTTDKDKPNYRMTKAEFQRGMEFCRKYFFLIYLEENATIDRLFERVDYLVRRHGIRIAIFDPYNQIEHLYNKGETIDLYVSRFMGKLKRFTVARRLCTLLIAHQNPPDKRAANGKDYPQPDIYKIKNGGTFADKSDNVGWTWRPYRITEESNPLVTIGFGKIKKKKLVGVPGFCDLLYDWKSNRYLDPLLKDKYGNPRNPLEIKTIALAENYVDDLPF